MQPPRQRWNEPSAAQQTSMPFKCLPVSLLDSFMDLSLFGPRGCMQPHETLVEGCPSNVCPFPSLTPLWTSHCLDLVDACSPLRHWWKAALQTSILFLP
eukprot:1158870-Pelagomonas_calceolata.AAC.4